MNNVLDVDQLNAYFGNFKALSNVTLSIPNEGLLVSILGPNGAGKSTFLKALLGLCSKTEGSVLFLGAPLKERTNEIAYVPQKETIDWNFPITVEELVMMGRFGYLKWWQKPKKQDHKIVKDCLEQLGITSLANRHISQLSGGQRQRAILARALAQEAKIYLLDEPFTGIDLATQQVIINLLKKLKQSGKTALIVHHDLTTLSSIFDWAILINQTLITFGPLDEAVNEVSLKKTYVN